MIEAYILIHHSLHSDAAVVSIDGIDYPIMTAPNGCRYVIHHKIRVIQQDPNKNSTYAHRARNGEKLSWVMDHPKWLLIDDSVVNSFPLKQGDHQKQTGDVSG